MRYTITPGNGTTLTRFFIFCVLTLLLASSAGIACAKDKHERRVGYGGPGQQSIQGYYTGPGPELVTIQQALSMPHGTWVAIKGKISKYHGGKEYTIADASGSADAKIGSKAWMGQNVSESDTVLMHGKVKKEWSHTRISVKRIIAQ